MAMTAMNMVNGGGGKSATSPLITVTTNVPLEWNNAPFKAKTAMCYSGYIYSGTYYTTRVTNVNPTTKEVLESGVYYSANGSAWALDSTRSITFTDSSVSVPNAAGGGVTQKATIFISTDVIDVDATV